MMQQLCWKPIFLFVCFHLQIKARNVFKIAVTNSTGHSVGIGKKEAHRFIIKVRKKSEPPSHQTIESQEVIGLILDFSSPFTSSTLLSEHLKGLLFDS